MTERAVRLEAHFRPSRSPLTFLVLLPGIAFTAFGVWMFFEGPAAFGIFPFLVGLVLLAVTGKMLLPATLVLTPEHVEWRSGWTHRRIAWKDVEGLEIERTERGSRVLTRYLVRVRGGAPLELNDAWEGHESVAASLQARRFAPDATLDVERAMGAAAYRANPGAAMGLDPDRLERFFSTVERALSQLGVQPARVDRELVRAHVGELDDHLFSLGRRCATEPLDCWDGIVRAHFESLLALRDESARALASDVLDADLRARLRPQLVRQLDVPEATVHRDALPGLHELVVLQLDHGAAVVPADRLEAWGTSADELFAIARANLAGDAPPEVGETEGCALFVGDDRTATRVLELGSILDLDPWLGAIVAVPAQNVLLARPVRDASDLVQLVDLRFASLAYLVHGRESRPLSPELFWWRPDGVELIQQGPDAEGRPVFVVPEELSGRLTGRIPRPTA